MNFLSEKDKSLLSSSKAHLRLFVFASLARQIENKWEFEELRKKNILELKKLSLDYLKKDKQVLLQFFCERLSEAMSLDAFLEALHPLEYIVSKELSDKDFFLSTEARISKKSSEKTSLSLILHNLRSSFNVGSLFRTADCFGLEALYLSGFSPSPLNPKLKKNSSWC